MKTLIKAVSLLMVAVLSLTMSATALAAMEDTGFSDVSADAWYAEAALYCRDHGIMSGTSDATFSPDTSITRAMLATVLYRMAGSPAVSAGAPTFSDAAAGAYYSSAVAWASSHGFVSGYGNGLFGVNDPVTREQAAAILWRYAGSPAPAGTADAFADQGDIASFAGSATAWARERGIMSGMSGNRFAPKNSVTRAQVATILLNYSRQNQTVPDTEPLPEPQEGLVLVAYFSATGTTEDIAQHLDAVLDADLYEIVPQQAYTSADLNYNDSNSRSQLELRDATARPAINGSVIGMDAYDVVFIGYPIWNGQAPKIISTFLESYDLAGKTIVPFCSSASSGIGSSASGLEHLTSGATWLSGQRFGGGADQAVVAQWVESLSLELASVA